MRRPRPAAAAWAAATLLLAVLGTASAARFVGGSHLAPAGDAPPLAFDDYALQFYYAQLGSRFLSERGVTWGYDPSFMAGYPKSALYYPSSKPFELALFALSGLGSLEPARAFDLSVFAMLAALPWLAWAAAAGFGLPPAERCGVVAFSAAPHLWVPIAGFYPILEAAGMAAFVFASSLSLAVVSAFARFLATGSRIAGAALLLAAPLLFWCHLTAGLLVAVPLAVLYARHFRSAPLARHAWLWAVLAATLAFNWIWIGGLIRFGHYADMGDFYTTGGQQHFAPPGGWLAPLRVHVPSPWPVALALPVFAAFGLERWWREGRRELLAILAPQIGFLFALAFYGAPLGLSALGPARFTLPLGLTCFFPAAHGLVSAWRLGERRLAARLPAGRLPAARTATAALLVIAAGAAGLHERVLRPVTLPELEARNRTDTRGLGLLDWLARHTDGGGRLLHEETDRASHRYYGSHLPAWIPLRGGPALAGGPAPHALLQHNSLRFIAGSFRGLHIERIPAEDMARSLALYNVRWVLCWSGHAIRYFEQYAGATRVGRYDAFALFRIDAEPSWFLRGRGRAAVREGRIELSELEPVDGRVVLKFHWLETLRSEPPRTLEPHFEAGDPVPFIAVVDPPRRLVIDQGPARG